MSFKAIPDDIFGFEPQVWRACVKASKLKISHEETKKCRNKNQT